MLVIHYDSGSQLAGRVEGVEVAHRGHSTVPEPFLVVITLGRNRCYCMWQAEARHAAEQPAMSSTAPYNKELSGPKYQ